MKFGKTITAHQVPEWSAHYINYKDLKKHIKEIANLQAALNQDNKDNNDDSRNHLNDPAIKRQLAAFFFSIDRNIELVDDFYNKQFSEYDKRLRKLTSIISSLNESSLDSDEAEEIIGVLVELRSVFRNLKWYGELNKRGFVKILKKLDKKCGTGQQESFLVARVYPLGFANESDILASLALINSHLNKLSPHVKSTRPRLSRHGSVSPDVFLPFIQNDDATSLIQSLVEQYRSIVLTPVKLLISLLNKSAVCESLNCIEKILEVIPSLTDPTDISGRNFFHHHVITLGKKVQKLEKKEEEITNVLKLQSHLNLTAAAAPTPNNRLIGSFGPDGINSNDSPKSLLYILKNLPAHLRPSLLQKDHYKRTPLHYAAQFGLKSITEIIISYLKEWNVWDENVAIDDLSYWGDAESLSPLHLAVLGSHPLTIQVLVKYSNHTLTSSKIFLLASRLNSPKILDILLDCKGVDIDFVDEHSNNETALYIASKLNFAPTVEFLLKMGANTEISESSFGWTPIFIVAVEGYLEIVQLLKNAGANFSKTDDSGWTPMEHACLRGHLKIADELKPAPKEYEELVQNVLNIYSSNNSSNASVNERPTSPLMRPMSPVDLGSSSSIDKQQQKNRESNVKQELYKALKQQKPVETPIASSTSPISTTPPKPVKQFGHRYLESDESLVILTLGSNDTRYDTPAVQLDRVPISKVHSTELDTALSLVVSRKQKNLESENGVEFEPIVIDLPFDEVEPVTIRTKGISPKDEIIYFDIVPTYGGHNKQQKILGRAVAILDKIYTKVGENRASLNKLVTLPIIETESLDLLGTINFEVLIVTPFIHPNLSITKTETYWKSLIQSRVIGHRGLGKNNNNKSSLQLGENTLESFIAASSLGASYVEFDVQLTKDHVPVIYHDFLVAESGADIPMHNLTLEQFLSMNEIPGDKSSKRSKDDDYVVLKSRPRSASHLTTWHEHSTTNSNIFTEKMRFTRTFKEKGFKGNNRGDSIASSFVTLADLFKKLPKNVGFNIECKFPLLFEAQCEDFGESFVELNFWIDTVLKVVFDNMEGRDIIFSSFHPEACVLLSLKQPNIPVLFLTESGTTFMPDVRAESLQSAIRFSKKWNLLGIVSASEPIIKCPRLAGVVKSSGLVCFSYGVMNNDPVNSRLQMEAGVDAVIVDNVLAVRKGLTKDSSGLDKKADQQTVQGQREEIEEVKKLVNETEI